MARFGSKGNSNRLSIATGMGISRVEISNIVKKIREPEPEIYPPLLNSVSNLVISEDLFDQTAVHEEYLAIFLKSPFNVKCNDEKDCDNVRRYTDKYRHSASELMNIDWSRIPAELHLKKGNVQRSLPKKMKIMDDDLFERIENLERLEPNEDDLRETDREEDDDEDGEQSLADEVDDEDNDYTLSYFDNGENYLSDGDDDL